MSYKIGFIFESYFPEQNSTAISTEIKPENALKYMETGLKVEGLIIDRGQLRPQSDIKLSQSEQNMLSDFQHIKYVMIVMKDGNYHKIEIPH